MNMFLLFCLLGLLACLGPLLLLLLLYLFQAYYRRWFPFQPARYPRREYYVQDQVIVTGAEGDVDGAMAAVENVRLSRVQRLRFRDLGDEVLRQCPDLPHGEGDQGLVVDLYHIEGLFPDVEKAIREIDAALARTGKSGRVVAEPNRLTGSAWEPEGSPWEAAGSAWEPEGSPLDELLKGGSKLPHSAPADLFPRQWAFRAIRLPEAADKPSGAGVRIGVFDTSPYPDQEIPSGMAVEQSLPWVQVSGQPMKLRVHHPLRRARLGRSSRPEVDVRNHGLFAAGLVHRLAEGADLHLVRVLGDDNRGDLFTMIEAIFEFIRQSLSSEPRPVGVVLNLSLGIRIPPPEARFNLPSSVLSFQYLMAAARCLGVYVSAAAGNDGSPQADLPAAWTTVMGVAASNLQDQHACFSNAGRIHAPGGDGAPGRGGTGCTPVNESCQGDCEYALIGPILQPPAHSGFVYWSGTSFAAPLVTGLAALVVQQGQGGLSPAEVDEILLCGASPDGPAQQNVIDVPRTLSDCFRRQQDRKQAGQV